MSVSEIRMIAFGDPKRNDNAFTVSSYSNSYGAQTRFITCGKKESFSKFNHGSIDWRGSTNGIHWLINSAETILSGESPKSAVAAGMTFEIRPIVLFLQNLLTNEYHLLSLSNKYFRD